ncbi:hypothetical protein EV192_104254 [Actinocrispum wychmicini]|uniref:Uncharacterized protein n=1 Tax=Actinocrispum wychmicini TaxID=1213861 RepID=A0A4R2JHR3_9PSEU|nr:hypothetical protein EV192_104254 [Actinocrispum wychmicini]
MESAALVVACWAAGQVRTSWTVVDAVVNVVLFVVVAPAYNYVLVAVLVVGLASTRLRWIVVIGWVVASVYAVVGVARANGPLWNIRPNAVSLAFVPVVPWLMARQIRAAVVRMDARHAEVIRRAEDLAARSLMIM